MSGSMMMQPGVPPQQGVPQPPPGMKPNPAFAAWQQQMQQVQQIQAENARRQQQFQEAWALVQRDGIHGFRLDIETDSTIAPDEQAEKQARVEFMQQFVPLMTGIVPMARGNPAIAALAKETVLFAVRGFRVGRELEENIEKAFDAIAQMPPDPKMAGDGKQPAQNPAVEMAKVKADVHDTELKSKTDMAAVAQKAQQAAMDTQVQMAKVGAEREKTMITAQIKAAELAQRDRAETVQAQTQTARDMTRGMV